MAGWEVAVEQLSLLSLSEFEIAAQDGENQKLSPVSSLRNDIHCKTLCDSIIVMHLIRHSGNCMTGWEVAVEQLSLQSLSEIEIAAQDGENQKVSPVWSLRNHIHCKTLCDSIIVMHLIRHSGNCMTGWEKPVEQLSLLSLSESEVLAAQYDCILKSLLSVMHMYYFWVSHHLQGIKK